MFSTIAVLSIVLLLYLWITPNVRVSQTRELARYEKVEDAAYKKIEDPASPIGIVREFRFQLALYRDQLKKSALEITLSFIDVLAGLLLLVVAGYFSRKKVENGGFYALAILAVSHFRCQAKRDDGASGGSRRTRVYSGRAALFLYFRLVRLIFCIRNRQKMIERPLKSMVRSW